MQITFDANKKKLDTNPVFGLLVQGENLAESIQITGPKMVGTLDLSQLRVAVRMTSAEYETTVEKTLEQTTDGDTITLIWEVDKQFTGSPGIVDVMLVGYGGNEEVIKITSSGMVVQEDKVFGTAPPESTWEQILQQMQDFATQAYESKTAAANSAAAAAASQKVAEEKAAQATNAANEAVKAAETAAADAAAQAAAKTEQQIRQYADDRYARALQGTADPAASITIYPDAGSNVAATAHGFTIQEGEEDPTPPTVEAQDFAFSRVTESASSMAVSYLITEDGKLSVDGLSSAGGATGFSVTRQTADNGATEKEYDGKTLYFMPFGPAGNILSAAVTELQNETTTNSGWKGATTAFLTVYLGDPNLDNIVKAPAMTQETTAVVMDAGFEITWVAVYFEGTTEKGTGFDMYLQIAVQALTVSGGNVRAIKNGGKYCNKKIFTGAESWAAYSNKTHTFYISAGTNINSGVSNFYKGITAGEFDAVNGIYVSNTLSHIISDLSCSTPEQFKQKLSDLYNAGTPLTLWFNKRVNEVDEKPQPGDIVYVPLTAQGGAFSGQCLEVTFPFCEGNTVVTKAKIECDKKIVVDGGPTESWRLAGSGTGSIFVLDGALPGNVGTPVNTIFSSRYAYANLSYGNSVEGISAWNEALYIRDLRFKDLESFKANLAENPLPIWYKTSGYKNGDATEVSLEKRSRGRKDLDGTEIWYANEGSKWCYTNSNTTLPKSADGAVICSHLKGRANTSYADVNWATVSTTGYVVLKSDMYAADKDALVRALVAMNAIGQPVQLEYELATPLVLVHDPVDFIANPGENGAWVITGEANGKVSAVYNKNLTHTIAELQAALLAVSAKRSL